MGGLKTRNAVQRLTPASMTTQLTTLTFTAGSADYAIATLTNSNPYGFVSQDEGHTVLAVIANLQARLAQVETKLKQYGLFV